MSDDIKRSSSFVSRIRDNTRKYLHELNEENAMLRQKTEVLECDKRILESNLVTLQSELEAERAEHKELFRRLEELEKLRASSAEEYALVEEQNNHLASLYSATYSLHGTLERDRVIGIIEEIVANLIGSEEVGVFEWSEADGELCLVASKGIDEAFYARLRPEEGIIGEAVRRRRAYLVGRSQVEATPAPGEEALTACIPLAIGEHLVGAIAVFRLLPQKQGIEPVDCELFELLGSQAAVAFYSATLHGRVSSPDP